MLIPDPMKLLLTIGILILSFTVMCQNQVDTLFLTNGDTIVCDIQHISGARSVSCILLEEGYEGKELVFKSYEIDSIYTTKNFPILVKPDNPGYFFERGGRAMSTAAYLNLTSGATAIFSVMLLNSNYTEIAYSLMAASLITSFIAVVVQINAGRWIRDGGRRLQSIELGGTQDGIGVKIKL